MKYQIGVGFIVMALSIALTGCGMLGGMFDAANSGSNNDTTGDAMNAAALTLGETVTLRGVVVENIQNCAVDGRCILRIDTTEGIRSVIYHYGEYPPCFNREAIQTGGEMQVGDQVEAVGMVVAQQAISTCESETYRITKVS